MTNNAFVTALTGSITDMQGAIWTVAGAAAVILIAMVTIKVIKRAFNKTT